MVGLAVVLGVLCLLFLVVLILRDFARNNQPQAKEKENQDAK